MNWKAIKYIYYRILIYRDKIEYLGRNRYKLTHYYSSGKKYWEKEYQNKQRHGKSIYWYENGKIWLEIEYKDGKFIK